MGRAPTAWPAVLAAGAAVAIWSTNALAAGAALEQLSLPQVLGLQFGAAAVTLALARLWLEVAGDESVRPALDRRAAAVGVIGIAGTIALQYLAFATAPLIAANAIAYSWPLIVAGWLASGAAGERSGRSVGAALVGFAGVLVLFAERGPSGGEASAPLLGYVAALGSAAAMAAYTLASAKLTGSRTDLLLIGTASGAAVAIPLALVQGDAWMVWPAVGFALYAGLGPMAAGYALWTYAMSRPDGARLAPVAYGTPLVSTLVLLASGASLSAQGLVGCTLIVICVAAVALGAERPRAAGRGGSGRRPRGSPGRPGTLT